ncbi:ABC transporter substrate-binding protein [Candidatus Fermentibacteria bacterium]|nr:ABC transporter substrate-binding protein [Candidatus Fermentibacteria bacterium]
MKRVLYVGLLLLVGAAVVFAGGKKEAPAVEGTAASGVVKIGFLAPLTGDAAAWGLPGLYGAQMWMEDVNAAGGIKAGGKSYKVELVTYDEENVASKALLGAKKLVLEDKVAVVLMMAGATVTACQSFFTENKVLSMSLAPYDTRAEAPYHLCAAEPSLVYHLASIPYIAKTYPNVKRVAIVAQDDEIGRQGLAYLRAACESAGLQVVYDKFYGFETTDFAPIMTAILNAKPDLISFDGGYSYYVELLAEQAYLMGFEGIIESSEFFLSSLLAKVPADWAEGAVASFADWDDPKLPKYCHDFYAEYTQRWPGQWGAVSWEYAANLDIWKFGVESADSIDPMEVFKALKSAETIPHVYGEGVWSGKEIWGIDNFLATPWHNTEVRNGKHVIVNTQPILGWFYQPGNKEILLKHLKAAGVYYVK